MSVLPRRALALVVALAVALAACGGGASAPAPLPGEPRRGDLAAVEAALAAQRGHACLLNFWATWCPPCVAELPDLVAAAKGYEGRGLRVLGVSYDGMVAGVDGVKAVEKVRAFLEKKKLALPTVVYDAPDFGKIDERFQLPGAIPVTLAFDKDGKLVDRHEGEATRERFEEMMRKALGE